MAISEDVLRILRSGLRLRQLRMLLVLAEHGSVHAASEVLGLSQPAVTKSLQEVEAVFGIELFQRTAHGITPTEPCKIILRFATDVDSNLTVALGALERQLSGEAEEISIGIAGGRATELMAMAIELHAQQQARLRVNLLEREPGRLIAAVISGRVQWAIGFRPAVPNDMAQFESLQSERYVLVARPGDRLLAGGKASVVELSTRPWVLHQPPPTVLDGWRNVFASVQAQHPPITIVAGSLPSFTANLHRLEGIGLVDATSARQITGFTVYEHVYFGSLWAVLGVLQSRQHRLTPAANALLDRVRAVSHAQTEKQREREHS